jgi:hypothetical protein
VAPPPAAFNAVPSLPVFGALLLSLLLCPDEDKTTDVDDANGRRRIAAVGVIVELSKAEAER